MRTRSRSTEVNPVSNALQRKYTYSATKVNGIYGLADCFPIRLTGDVAQPQTNAMMSLVFNDSEVMTDELSTDRRVKYVDHVRRIQPRFRKYDYCTDSAMSALSKYGSPISKIYTQTFFKESFSPDWNAWMAASAYAGFDYRLGIDNQMGLTMPADKLAELPAAVVKKLDEFHLTTFAIESRDLPDLYRLFTKRGLLRNAANLLKAIRRGTCSKTIQEFLRLLREGQLGYAFGLAPTVQDVRTISKILSKGVKARKRTITCYRVGNVNRYASYTPSGQDPFLGYWKLGEEFGLRRIDGVRVQESIPAIEEDNQFYNMYYRLAGANPLGVCWEVIPFSFMVDWLVAVDDVLDSVFLNKNTRFKCEYWTSFKYSYTRQVSAQHLANITSVESSSPVAVKQWVNNDVLRGEYSHYNRVLRAPPSPFDSARAKGANMYNIFLSCLVALGLRSGR